MPDEELAFTYLHPRYARFDIGKWTYGLPEVLFGESGAKLTIGKFCSIANGATILLGSEHRLDWVTTYPFPALIPGAEHYSGYRRAKGDITIGNDVWIGQNVIVLSGVTIGNGAVIGAGSVVTKDVAAYSIAAGNPARHIRFRFEQDIIEALQRIAWWDWPEQQIEEAWPLMLSTRVREFVNTYDCR